MNKYRSTRGKHGPKPRGSIENFLMAVDEAARSAVARVVQVENDGSVAPEDQGLRRVAIIAQKMGEIVGGIRAASAGEDPDSVEHVVNEARHRFCNCVERMLADFGHTPAGQA